ncbi:MAG: SpoIIIAH-like family protein [Eubacteriales bacterium]
MKGILKKNQIMITSLAIMIAIAGYLNFTGNQLEHEDLIATSGTGITNDTIEVLDGELIEIESLDTDIELSQADLYEDAEEVANLDYLDTTMELVADNPIADGDTPGEAVFTSSTNVSTLSGAKLLKEQTRAKNKETLLEIINSTTIDATQKQSAIDAMVELTDFAEKESAAEILLETKGFYDAVVSMSADSVDVIINLETIDDVDRAQIEDIVKRKTGMEAQNIIITPMGSGE